MDKLLNAKKPGKIKGNEDKWSYFALIRKINMRTVKKFI